MHDQSKPELGAGWTLDTTYAKPSIVLCAVKRLTVHVSAEVRGVFKTPSKVVKIVVCWVARFCDGQFTATNVTRLVKSGLYDFRRYQDA